MHVRRYKRWAWQVLSRFRHTQVARYSVAVLSSEADDCVEKGLGNGEKGRGGNGTSAESNWEGREERLRGVSVRSLPSLVENLFRPALSGPGLQLYITCYNTIWIFVFASVVYAVVRTPPICRHPSIPCIALWHRKGFKKTTKQFSPTWVVFHRTATGNLR